MVPTDKGFEPSVWRRVVDGFVRRRGFLFLVILSWGGLGVVVFDAGLSRRNLVGVVTLIL
ncbi:MAG: hypothetical protein IKY61_07620 [Thermoguttaceae bacterium]|nr:hypothetical protein [Thermoguttaceae bacterium]